MPGFPIESLSVKERKASVYVSVGRVADDRPCTEEMFAQGLMETVSPKIKCLPTNHAREARHGITLLVARLSPSRPAVASVRPQGVSHRPLVQ
ncbi:Hypothetical protein NTJ_00132 [Nesidiocoris tenuis]|uniref:Uncharacterized protein n=1 Tax=Nesidiocoris tenuis TaxID=355587 RepID=A0ABN7A566_9HEMI|nr:Hypothetical protein NTJ_00132 [Nesidiocoris tenuis]